LTQQLTSSPRKRVLDEGSFQDLLAAAFVLQKRNELASHPSANFKEVLSEVVRIQRLIRSGQSSLAETAKLICQQAQKFVKADGVSIGIVTHDEIVYLAAVGSAAGEIGRRISIEASLPCHCIRTGVTMRSPRAQDDSRLFSLDDTTEVKSYIAVPVDFDNEIVGVLEARFKIANAFADDDVGACELIAALVKDLIAEAGHAQVEADPAAPPVSVKPVYFSQMKVTAPQVSSQEMSAEGSSPAPVLEALPACTANEIVLAAEASGQISAERNFCRGCHQPLAEEELFCGKCGTEKIINPDGPLQSKWASLWFMNQARTVKAGFELPERPPDAQNLTKPAAAEAPAEERAEAIQEHAELEASPSAAIADDLISVPVVMESKPRLTVEWLPDIAAPKKQSWLRHQWNVNRANFYLAGAALVLMIVLSGVGTNSAIDLPPANGSVPQLTLLERMLVGLGIAEAPQAPAYYGNPDTPVWVDLHTALYYCPGSDLYGKTEGGKIATQRSAQMDQFEPAHRKACN
jgi:putative methionine-R-sulfoxide reductase with GAF domain